ncbi:hypothetical protein COLO4_17782 [Corchorus olitorius]|uniref:Uncharacterized protein n=1 Tax=Corchorus olitorius TaxID=93759 RepID=A0A1R3JBH0_9ROSI|nr:hypothetical protein COLO4_17782 [Corchorus olitorius]
MHDWTIFFDLEYGGNWGQLARFKTNKAEFRCFGPTPISSNPKRNGPGNTFAQPALY